MKFKNILSLLAILCGMLFSFAQTPVYKTSTTVSAIGTNNLSTASITIPEGKNRVAIVQIWFERDQRSTNNGNNWPIPPQSTVGNYQNTAYMPNIKIGSTSMRALASNYFSYGNQGGNANVDQIGNVLYTYILTDPNLPTGTVSVDFSSIQAAKNLGDEVVATIEVYDNVSSTTTFANAGGNFWSSSGAGLAAGTTNNVSTFEQTLTVPAKHSSSNASSQLMFVGIGVTSQSGISTSLTSGDVNWTPVSNLSVSNTGGTAVTIGNDAPQNEPDGISLRSGYYIGTPTSYTLTRSSTNRILIARMRTIGLLPLANPAVSGTVYRDTTNDGNVNGTPTNAGGSFVNVVGSDGKVVASVEVAADGTFKILQGTLQERNTYTFQLSSVKGVAGQVPPAVSLNNYTYVGEDLDASGNDGIADGQLEVSVLVDDITGIRFGVNTCMAGAVAPVASNPTLNITCSPTSINLTSAGIAPAPTGSVIRWMDGSNPATANVITNTTVSTAKTYYVFYYDTAANCYSPGTAVVVKQICAVDDNYTATATQAVSGTTFTPSILSNDTKNNTTPALSDVILTVVTPATSIGGGPVPALNTSTGQVTLPAGTPAGEYTIRYRICDTTGNPCSEANIKVVVPTTTIIADNDDYSATPISSQTGGSTPSVFANDNYNGGADGSVNSTNALATQVGTWPNGITLDPNTGRINIAPGTPANEYNVIYRICDKINTTVCDTATVKIVVNNDYCYFLPNTAGTSAPTKHGITALTRASGNANEWPTARQSAWTVLEAKTKGFVVNRVAFASNGNPIGIAPANYVEGMMVYDTTNNCLKIYDGTVWYCYSTPGCPIIPIVANFNYQFDCASATVTPAMIQGVNQSGTITVPVTVTGDGNIPGFVRTINGVTFTLVDIPNANSSITNVTISYSGTPTGVSTSLPLSSFSGTPCNVIIPHAAGNAAYTCNTATANGTYTVGTAVSSSNTLTLNLNVTQVGNYPAFSYTGGGVTFTAPAGSFTTTGVKTITLTATGTPTTAGNNALTPNPNTLCSASFTANTAAGIATLNCAGATYKSGNTLVANQAGNTIVYTLPYSSGNGGSYSATNFDSTGVTGLQASIASGTFATGTGSLEISITGTPSGNGNANFSITIGGSTCTITVPVVSANSSAVTACNDSSQFGRNITTDINSWTNITTPGGKTLGVRAAPGSGLNTSTGSFCNPQALGGIYYGSYCGGITANSAVNLRIGSSPIATGTLCNNKSVTYTFDKPVNDITVHSTWYNYTGVNLEGPDNLTMSVNGGGTLSYATTTSCASQFNITTSGNSVKATATLTALNSNGIIFRLRSTQPFTEITISNTSGGDDTIVALSYCNAVAY